MLRLETANMVVVGNFNPYLISPQWLAARDIWRCEGIHLALGALRNDGVQFRGGGVEWFVSSDRMVVDSTVADCGGLIARVLTDLPHTPLSAVGSNFAFSVSGEGWSSQVVDSIMSYFDGTDIARWGAVFHDDESRVEMNCVSGDEGITISMNRHRTASALKEVIAACNNFASDKEWADAKATQIFKKAFSK